MDGTVIVADDDRTIRTVLSQALTRAGCRVRATSTMTTLWQWIEEGEGDVVVSDVMMPDGDALDLMPAIARKRSDLPVIIMSAQNTVMTAIRAAEAGAYEYLPKPFDLREMLGHVSKALARKSGTPALEISAEHAPPEQKPLPLIGGSPAMQEVYRILARLMNSDLSVLITGETGTGKQLVAKALHNYGHRSAYEFVSVNVGSSSADLIEAELFGREAIGARAAQPGKLEKAIGGTLYLNDIADMPLAVQKRLLPVLQNGRIRRSSDGVELTADIRIVAATKHDIPDLINEGKFREDLYYRLNVVPVQLPPLRDRVEDIPELARQFLKNSQGRSAGAKYFSKGALEILRKERWPGNVRELENFVLRLVALSSTDLIDEGQVEAEMARHPNALSSNDNVDGLSLSSSVQSHLQRYFDLHSDDLPPPGLYHRTLREVEMPLFALTLSATRGNQVKAAEVLGINRNTLRKKVRELDIRVTRGKTLM